jgi:hypothetical protein
MRFVPVKEEHQQIILSLHRTRQGFVEERTATYNRLRGLISEFGIVLPQKVANLRRDIIGCAWKTCRATPISASATCWPTPTGWMSGSRSTTGSSPRPHGTMRAASA